MTWIRVVLVVLLMAAAAWYAWRRDFGIIATNWVGALGGLLCMIAGLVLLIRRHRRQPSIDL
jgi:hypothetical protein